MSIDKIRNELIADAQTEAGRTLRSAERAAEQQLAKAREQIKAETERKTRDLQAELEANRNLELIKVRSANGLEILSRKNEIVEKIFEDATKQFEQLPQDQYVALLERQLLSVDPNAPGEVHANPRDLPLLRDQVIPKVNEQRRDGAKFSAAEQPIDVRGGFIFRSQRFELDNTLEAIVRRLKETLAVEIATEIFRD